MLHQSIKHLVGSDPHHPVVSSDASHAILHHRQQAVKVAQRRTPLDEVLADGNTPGDTPDHDRVCDVGASVPTGLVLGRLNPLCSSPFQ